MDLYDVRNKLTSGRTIYDLPLRVTYYARVSTDKYEQVNSLQNQVDYFRDMIKAHKGWSFVDGYIDEGLSGTSVNKRDAFLKMIRDAKAGKFDFIITKEISRFSRNTLDSIKYTQELLSSGVGVLFQSDNINTLYPDSELRLTIMSSIAQEEVRKISERVKFGFQRSIEKGVVLGNNAIWGYKKENGRLVVMEEEAVIIRLIFELYAIQKLGVRQVSRELDAQGYRNSNGNPFSFTTIKNIISNPKYKGYYCGNKTRIVDYRLKHRVNINQEEWVTYKDEESVPAIVSEEIWEAANRIMRGRSEKAKNNETAYQSRYTYSGKIFCDEHDTTFHRTIYKYKSGNKEVWQCKRYRELGKSGCNTPTLYTSELDAVLKDAFEEFVLKKSDIIARMIERYNIALNDDNISDEIAKKRQSISKVAVKKDKLLELSIDGKISNDEFGSRNDVFNKEIEAISEEIRGLESQRDDIIRTRESIKNLSDVISKKVAMADDDQGSEIISTALEKIVTCKTEDKNRVMLKIYFKFDQNCEAFIERGSKGSFAHHFATSHTYDARRYLN